MTEHDYDAAFEANRIKTFSVIFTGSSPEVTKDMNRVLNQKGVEYVNHSFINGPGCYAISLIYKAKAEVK